MGSFLRTNNRIKTIHLRIKEKAPQEIIPRGLFCICCRLDQYNINHREHQDAQKDFGVVLSNPFER